MQVCSHSLDKSGISLHLAPGDYLQLTVCIYSFIILYFRTSNLCLINSIFANFPSYLT